MVGGEAIFGGLLATLSELSTKIGFFLIKRYTATEVLTDEYIMFKCAVTLLLIPCLLLSQTAAVAHSHGEYTVEGHGVRAHIHVQGKAPSACHDEEQEHSHHAHGHSHKHGHSHSAKQSEKHETSASKKTNGSYSEPYQHDADCIYLTDVVAPGFERVTFEKSCDSVNICLSTIWDETDTKLRGSALRFYRPPPIRPYSCPLYLQHLSLLI